MSEFEREDRYLVLKRSDIKKYLVEIDKLELEVMAEQIANSRMDDGRNRDMPCVVVERDWPIYEQVWDAVQRLAEGRTQKVEDLQQQLNEQKAHVERLSESVNEMMNWVRSKGFDVAGSGVFSFAESLLNQTPKQSLASYDLKLVEKMIKHILANYPNGALHSLNEFAQQLREQAKG